MSMSENQIMRVADVKECIAALLRDGLSAQEIAEHLEDAANVLLDVSEELTQSIFAGRTPSIQPTQDPHSECP